MQAQEEIYRRSNIYTGEGKNKRIYSSKYALSAITFCGYCGDIYRRTYWNKVLEDDISEEKMGNIVLDINEKLKYKHELLDYLVYLINECDSSNELHQEIAKYLGVEKHMLNRIYSTVKGDKVRSKSEVIIANLLADNGIDYDYEKKLEYADGGWIEPDFTIKNEDGTELYWEHLGMLGVESYDNRRLRKQDIYEKYFPDKLIITYEGANITNNALDIIKKITSNSND